MAQGRPKDRQRPLRIPKDCSRTQMGPPRIQRSPKIVKRTYGFSRIFKTRQSFPREPKDLQGTLKNTQRCSEGFQKTPKATPTHAAPQRHPSSPRTPQGTSKGTEGRPWRALTRSQWTTLIFTIFPATEAPPDEPNAFLTSLDAPDDQGPPNDDQ